MVELRMPNLEAVVMLIKNTDTVTKEIKKFNKPYKLFDNNILKFLETFNNEIKKNRQFRNFPDLFFLNFWLRKKNLDKIKLEYGNLNDRIGLGVLFHITPSNMPTSFFYSFVFGILTGNVNIIRLPSKNYDQVNIILKTLERVFKINKFKEIKNTSFFVKYSDKYETTKIFSSLCNARIIWGGDETINKIRQIDLPAKSREITFSDRISLSVFNANKIYNLTNNSLEKLCNSFFSDAYFIDQNACSSPHLILWYGNNFVRAKNKFWKKLTEIALIKYDLPEIGALEKFSHYCDDVINNKVITKKLTNTFVYNFDLKNQKINLDKSRSKWGYFYEKKLSNLNDLKKFDNVKNQTLTYFGFKKDLLLNVVIKNNLLGIDRIVPVGHAHDISTKWDGYDIVYSFSRVVDSF